MTDHDPRGHGKISLAEVPTGPPLQLKNYTRRISTAATVTVFALLMLAEEERNLSLARPIRRNDNND
jgi:hypothetical protein